MTNEELKKELKAAKATIAEQEAITIDMQKTLDAAAKDVKTAEAAAPKKVVVKVGDTKYEVVSGCHLPGAGKFTAKEIAKDKNVVAAILKLKGQNILNPQ